MLIRAALARISAAEAALGGKVVEDREQQRLDAAENTAAVERSRREVLQKDIEQLQKAANKTSYNKFQSFKNLRYI